MLWLRLRYIYFMKKLQYFIQIHAQKEKVWRTLWADQTFREWASVIDEGTYMTGEMKEGIEVQFISSVNGYGVTSLIESLIPNEYVLLRHQADTKESGGQVREDEWTGGQESYSLRENGGMTTLTVEQDVPPELVDIFEERIPKALEKVKSLAENKGYKSPRVKDSESK